MIYDVIARNRSYRKFDHTYPIETDILVSLIELARLSPSAMNRQPLRFAPVNDSKLCDVIFDHTGWAGYLGPEGRPQPNQAPSAYIIALTDIEPDHNVYIDLGIALQSMLLCAVELGLGGCIIGSVQRDKLKPALNIPDQYHILCVLGLGKPVETVRIEELPPDGSIKYWRDPDGTHHVPKRSVEELMIRL